MPLEDESMSIRKQVLDSLLSQLEIDDETKEYLASLDVVQVYVFHTTLSGGPSGTPAGLFRKVSHIGDVRSWTTHAIGWQYKATIEGVSAKKAGGKSYTKTWRPLYADETDGLGVAPRGKADAHTRQIQRLIDKANRRRLTSEAKYDALYAEDPTKAARYWQRVEAGRQRWAGHKRKIPKRKQAKRKSKLSHKEASRLRWE